MRGVAEGLSRSSEKFFGLVATLLISKPLENALSPSPEKKRVEKKREREREKERERERERERRNLSARLLGHLCLFEGFEQPQQWTC